MIKNGIILTGGTGSRLFPLTHTINKHLLNINGKFIIDYPLQTLKNIGVENLNVILGGSHFEQVVEYLKDGSDFGFNINYIFQKEPKGISQAINLCKRYLLDEEEFVVVLGDNLYQQPISNRVLNGKAKVVLNKHPELNRFGVATLNQKNRISKIEEKPQILNPNDRNYAITGCYFFNQKFFEYFDRSVVSERGEYEITSILQAYNNDDNLIYSIADGWWIDAGMFGSIEEASFLTTKIFKKKCRNCNSEKTIDQFYSDRGVPGTYCKECDQKEEMNTMKIKIEN